MPVNRNALIRYKTIDKCLQNRFRKWTLADLIDACSDALYEYEGIEKGVSKRSVQADIQMMRSDKLGYNAPIIVSEKKYYTYEDPKYSITNIPITNQDLTRLSEAVEFLKQFKGFSHFKELDGMVQKLEDHVYAQKTKQKKVIDFEKNENLKGLEYLDVLYQSIIQKRTIKITYQSFKARQASSFDFFPYLLKEFRNRWFIVGKRDAQQGILNLALDRIIDIEESKLAFVDSKNFDSENYFRHAIGVSVSPAAKTQKLILFVTHKHAPYVITKPLHWSQQLIKKDNYGITISIDVQHNFELEKEILSLGDGIKVLAPFRLRKIIKERLSNSIDLYNTELSENGLITAKRRLVHKGFSILNHIYTQREIRKARKLLDNYFRENEEEGIFAKRKILKNIPPLKQVLFNENLKQIVQTIDKDAFLSKAIYFDKTAKSNWYVNWHQDVPINVAKKIPTTGFQSWTNKKGVVSVCPPIEIVQNIFTIRIHLDDTSATNGALKVVSGSHGKRLGDKEIKLISSNCTPFICEVPSGGILLLKPLLLHASSKTKNQKRRRVVHLEFTSSELPNGMEWAEREEV